MLHNNQRLFNKVLTLTALGLAFTFIFLLRAVPIGAESDSGISPGETNEQPKERTTQVTASVSDNESPTTPILIAPTDDKKLTQSKPTFTWESSTDNFAMSHYILVHNGATKFDDIPLDDSDNSDYTLTYDSTEDEYSLVVKNSLSDGSYTWKIVAVDIHDNEASSVTWDFSIDTKAPTFIITTIDGQTVEISNQDTSTVPDSAIELTNNEPDMSGTGEGSSTVKLTVTLQDSSTQEYNFSIGSDGKWSVSLDTLPRDQILYLDFIITDSYGNVSILSDVPVTLSTPVLVIPLPTLPSKSTANPPQIVVPLLPLPELLPPVLRTLPKQIIYYVRSYELTTRLIVVAFWEHFWKIAVVVLLLILPLFKLVLLGTWWWSYLSAHLFKQLLWAIGCWKPQRLQGITVSRVNQSSIGFSMVIVSGKTTAGLPYKQEWLTNQDGAFPRLVLPEGKFRISMKHPLYFFPSLEKRPEHLEENTYYTGSEFAVEKDDADRLLVLVAEPLEYAQNTQLYQLRQSILTLPALSIPLTVLGGCITIIFPGIFNILGLSLYIFLLIWKKYQEISRKLTIDIRDNNKMPIHNVVLAVRDTKQRYFSSLTQTNSLGISRVKQEQGNYLIWTIDLRRQQTEGDKKTLTAINVTSATNYIPLILSE